MSQYPDPGCWSVASMPVDPTVHGQVFDIPDDWEPFGITPGRVWIRQHRRRNLEALTETEQQT